MPLGVGDGMESDYGHLGAMGQGSIISPDGRGLDGVGVGGWHGVLMGQLVINFGVSDVDLDCLYFIAKLLTLTRAIKSVNSWG